MGYVVIAAFVGLVLLGLAQWSRIARRRERTEPPPGPGGTGPDERPDRPRAFGPRLAWFAVRASGADEVAQALQARTVVAANWLTGLERARAGGVFVTPPVDGWVFAAGRDVFPRLRGSVAPVDALLAGLGRRFGSALWFATHDVMDFHGWAIALGGQIVRGFAYDGEGPAIVWDHGAVTEVEQQLGFFTEDPRDTSDDPIRWWPSPREVLTLAAALGADPTALDRHHGPGIGRLGRL